MGIIALAAVQLSQKAITDKLTRILVFFGATAGMLYNALWYFPLLMFVGGIATIVWDYRVGHRLFEKLRLNREAADRDNEAQVHPIAMDEVAASNLPMRRHQARSTQSNGVSGGSTTNSPVEDQQRVVPAPIEMRVFSWKFGLAVMAGFFATFITVMVLRGVLKHRPRGFNLFANLYLAGTLSPCN